MIILSIFFFITAILYSSVGFGGGSTYLALLLINNNNPAIDKTKNNIISNIFLSIIKVPPIKANGIDPIKNGINILKL